MEFTVEQQIGCTPERAFDLMADARNETSWNSAVSRSELQSGEPVGEGSRFLTVNRGREYDATIATYERPSKLVFDVRGQMDITATFTFAPADGGTAVRGRFDFRPKGAMKLMAPLLRPMIGASLRKESASFKSLCEETAAAGD